VARAQHAQHIVAMRLMLASLEAEAHADAGLNGLLGD